MEDDSCIKICVRKRPLNEKGMHIIFINIINCLIYMCITVKLIYNIHYICISYYIIILNNSIIMMIIKIIKKKKKRNCFFELFKYIIKLSIVMIKVHLGKLLKEN